MKEAVQQPKEEESGEEERGGVEEMVEGVEEIGPLLLFEDLLPALLQEGDEGSIGWNLRYIPELSELALQSGDLTLPLFDLFLDMVHIAYQDGSIPIDLGDTLQEHVGVLALPLADLYLKLGDPPFEGLDGFEAGANFQIVNESLQPPPQLLAKGMAPKEMLHIPGLHLPIQLLNRQDPFPSLPMLLDLLGPFSQFDTAVAKFAIGRIERGGLKGNPLTDKPDHENRIEKKGQLSPRGEGLAIMVEKGLTPRVPPPLHPPMHVFSPCFMKL